MALRYYANSPATTLAASCTASATSIVVTSATGLPVQYPFTLILDRGTSTEEAVSVTAAAGTTLTVTRGIDGTTAFAHTNSASVVHGITAQDVREPNSHVNSNSGVHGATGSIVGTTDTQTLSNKTLTSPTLNTPVSSGGTFTSPTLVTPSATNADLAGLGGAWSVYTPSWTSTGTAPAIGNGTLTGRYIQIGKFVATELLFTAGTTTTFGTGTYRFSLPVAAANFFVQYTNLGGTCHAADSSAGNSYVLFPRFVNTTTLELTFHGIAANGFLAGLVTEAAPFVWANADTMGGLFFYEAA